jgi:benzoylformate decarboxylase
MAKLQLSKALEGFDLVLVVGAEAWRYYPYVAGKTILDSTRLLHITNDHHDVGSALVGACLLSDARLALDGLHRLI